MKRNLSLFLILVLLVTLFTGCAQPEAVEEVQQSAAPKYVFLFIGDGMSYPQIQLASDYLGAITAPGTKPIPAPQPLSFMNFSTVGTAMNYSTDSYIPDSASTATAILTGQKTNSGSIGMDYTGATKLASVCELVSEQTEMKIGVISSAGINHATPAATYAHQYSRGDFYAIGHELIASGYEYFSGGGFHQPRGADWNQESLYDKAEAAGYRVVRTQQEAELVTEGPVIIADEYALDETSMLYEIDRPDHVWGLSDHVKKAIEVLDNEKGFFLMCESGKIDMAGHANDAVTMMQETIALADAVQVAVDFAAEHPEETLIVVTADHETGGMTIGTAAMQYKTNLPLLAGQNISYEQFSRIYVVGYGGKHPSFKQVMADVEDCFGLKLEGEEGDPAVLTKSEKADMRMAYRKVIQGLGTGLSAEDYYAAYGAENPLTVTITHILDRKAGVDFTSYVHSGLPVPVFAQGVGEELFDGYYDNTQIYRNLVQVLELE